jgi:hypothetical protein
MIDKLVVEIIAILHILIWLFVIFGGFISVNYLYINIFIIIPAIYVLHMLNFHILNKVKLNLLHIEEEDNNKLSEINHCSKQCEPNEELDKYLNKYILPKILNNIKYYYRHSFGNPVSPQGLLILGYIVNVYAMKYHWHLI